MRVGAAVALAQFEAFRTVGTSLLASAGVAGIILGVAAQDSLSNVLAGMQIASTELVRIGDTVTLDGNLGTVEDIAYTNLIVRTWDRRRIACSTATSSPTRWRAGHDLDRADATGLDGRALACGEVGVGANE